MADPPRQRDLRGRVTRAARLGAASLGASAGWLAGAAIQGLGGAGPAEKLRRAMAAGLAERLGRLKGLAMKLGQILSFAIDDIPVELRDALEALQTSSSPRPFSEIAPVIERSLRRPLRDAFADVDPAPIASASIGQVHRARLDDGTAVAVKVQYPDVAAAVRADLANLSMVVGWVRLLAPRVDAERVALELRERVLEELDYAAEARHQAAFAARFEGHPFIAVPAVIASHSAREVLTSELVAGRRFPEVLGDGDDVRSRFGEIIFRFVYGCIFRWGTFDGDPHPGNYLFDRLGSRVTFLDFGCVKQLPPPVLRELRGFVRAGLEGERAAGRAHVRRIGFFTGEDEAFAGRVADALTGLYLPFRLDAGQRFPSLWRGRSVTEVLGGELAELRRHLSIPNDLVFVNRTLAGAYLVLSRFGAAASWGGIAREYVCGAPPSTALGEAERAWERARRGGSGPGHTP